MGWRRGEEERGEGERRGGEMRGAKCRWFLYMYSKFTDFDQRCQVNEKTKMSWTS